MSSIPRLRISLDQHPPPNESQTHTVAVLPLQHSNNDTSNSEAFLDKKSTHEKEDSSGSLPDDHDGPLGNREEPLIRNGKDISEFVVSVRDDGDTGLTFRSFVLGTTFAGLAATLSQIYLFKPTFATISPIFLLIIIYAFGNIWAVYFPRPSPAGRFKFLAPLSVFVNPGPFTLKEHAVASLVAITASRNSTAVLTFAVQKLYYDTQVKAGTAVLATFSTACFGYGLVGVLRPLTIYPSEMVYWTNLPAVTAFQALHFDTAANRGRVKLFWTAGVGMLCYEIFPAYIFPLLNGVSVFCLASQSASEKTRDTFTTIFGGAEGNEGLGLLSLSFDWQYIGSQYMSMPLIQQANGWIGHIFCYVAFVAIYYTNTWKSRTFPFLSSALFAANGTVYPQSSVFDSNFMLNQTALSEIGLPSFSGSNVWGLTASNLSIGAMMTHVLLFWGPSMMESFRLSRKNEEPDRHYQAMQKYNEAPWWWYAILLALSFFAGLIVVLKGQTGLTAWSYIIALVVGTAIAPIATVFTARMGYNINVVMVTKMLAGFIHPGRPIANLYFSMWSNDVVGTTFNLSTDMKMGQYLKIPPRVMFLTQIWGTILGALVNYVVMISVVTSQREILLNPLGTNVWSGQMVQIQNSSGVTWSMAKELYSAGQPYFIIPLALLLGMFPTVFQWLVWKRYPKIGPLKIDTIVLPLIFMYGAFLSVGVTSTILSTVIVGVSSQVWLRRYHRKWYRKYNYILGGALDGGAQLMILILSFAVYGVGGARRPFPHWAGNPAKGNVDYCNGNGALSRSRS